MKTIYIIGAPGAGKTTLANAFKNNWRKVRQDTKPVKYEAFVLNNGETALSLGWDKPPFGGTDTLSYTAIVQIEQWLPQVKVDYLFGEGDRLAIDRFIHLAQELGDLHLFYLNTDPALAADRRGERADANNLKQQDPTWVKGRESKHLKLALKHNATFIPGNLTIQQMCGLMWNEITPTETIGWE
jgi:GTPase SAR1 family protein